jgi:PleD family two-component response regulator
VLRDRDRLSRAGGKNRRKSVKSTSRSPQRLVGKLYNSHIDPVAMKPDLRSAQMPPVVLVADDDVDVRSSLEEGLRDAGYQPHCVRNGDEALAYLRKNPRPSAILLDLFMPVMNGWQFVHNLRGTRLDTSRSSW